MPVLGTCSRCGGPVMTPDLWGGVIPPTPTCATCGAVKPNPYGSVIDMEPPATTISNGTGNWPKGLKS